MASQRTGERSNTKERSRLEQREQRAERILDAAAELMLRWGYNKTTIDDIVRQAGVPKGTIYLHWKTREELFLALMEREYTRLIRDTQQRIASDPDGGTMWGITKHAMLATMKSPLMKAVMLRDTDLLGEWLHKEYARASFMQQIAQPLALLERYQAQGVVRNDIDARRMVYMLKAISLGFLVIDEYMPDDFKYSDEEIADMTAEVIRRTFIPPSSSDAQSDEQTKQELANNFIASLDNVLAIRNEKDQEESQL